MKRTLLVAFVLALCLSLAACELPFMSNQDNAQDYTEVYSCIEQQNYHEAMEVLCRLQQGQPGASNMVSDEVAAKYAELEKMLIGKDYSSAAKYIAEKAVDFLQTAGGQPPAPEILGTGWYELSSNPDFEKEAYLSFYENGIFSTSRYQGEMLWIVREYTAAQLNIEIYYVDGLQSAGSVCFIINGTDEPELRYTYQNRVGESVQLQYVRDRLLTGEFCDWQTPEQSEEFPAELSLDGSQAVIAGERYPFVRNENGEMQIMKADGSVWFTARLNMDQERYTLELMNDWTQCTYYAPGEDYAYGEMVYHYERALDVLRCLEGSDSGLDYNGDDRSRQEWFAYIYQAMRNADGYGESKKILSNFTILEDLLVGVGEQRDLLLKEYKYDSQGRVIYARDADLTLQYYGVQGLYSQGMEYDDRYHFEYDASGRISKITHMDVQTLVSTITPVYDDKGRIDRLEISMADGTVRSANYVYDSDIMMPFATVPTARETDVLREISYGDYFLNFSWTPDSENYWFNGVSGWINCKGEDVSYSSSWKTDENHVLTEKTIWISGDNMEILEFRTYTYDESGRLTAEKVVTTQGDNLREVTYQYFYESQYFYNFDAE